MMPIVHALLGFVIGMFRARIDLQLENVALRHQLSLYQQSIRRPPIRPRDRMLWAWLAKHWSQWREVLVFVQPATVLAWQRRRFREHWARLSWRKPPGRPAVSSELRALIRDISTGNPRWGPRGSWGSCGSSGSRWPNPRSRNTACASAAPSPPLAGVSKESPAGDHRAGLLHGPDGQLQGALRVHRAGA